MEKTKHNLKMIVHDIKTTLAVLENAFNGVIESPTSKEQYRTLFEKGKARIIKDMSELVEKFEKSIGSHK